MEKAKKARKTNKRLYTVAAKSLEAIFTSKPTLEQIEKEVEKFDSIYYQLSEANDEVIRKLPDDASEQEANQCIVYLDEVNEDRSKLLKIVHDIKIDILKQKDEDSSKPFLTTTVKPNCQLERLKIQTFNGNVREYPGWKKSFEHCMNKHCQDEDDQLQRLKEAIQYPARKEIAHCLTVESAFSILDKSYGNKDELVSLLLYDIKSYRSLKRGDSKTLKAFAIELRSFITRIKNLDQSSDLKSSYIIIDVMDKLLPEDQYKFKCHCHDKEIPKSLETLADWLTEEVQLRLGSYDDSHTLPKSQFKPSPPKTNQVSKPVIRPCLMKCIENHLLKDCPKFVALSVAERWEVTKANKCCFCCLRPGHRTHVCFQSKQCTKNNCTKYHNVLLHEAIQATPTSTNYVSHESLLYGILPILKIHVFDDYGTAHEAIAMKDSGSQQSLIKKSFANKLRLKGVNCGSLHVILAGGSELIEASNLYNIKVSELNSDEQYSLQVNSLKTVCGDAMPIPKEKLLAYPHLSECISDIYCDGGPVDVLIGTNFPIAFKDIATLSTDDEHSPIAKKTPLGWVLLGSLGSQDKVSHINHVTILPEPNISKYFEIESLGIKPTKFCTCRESELIESSFMENLAQNTKVLPDGRVQVKMPWKPGQPNLPNNKTTAYNRLVSLENRLIKSTKVEKYDQEIQKLLDEQFCIKLTEDQVTSDQNAWYLPHREVIRPEANSTKVRIVFDSSAEYEGASLNKSLEKGPNFLNDLFSVLIGWRHEETAYCSDITKMFNMISIHPDDQPYHRFLWRNCQQDIEPSVYQWVRLPFGDKPSPDLACSVIRWLADNYKSSYPRAELLLKHHIYMDDIAHSSNNISDITSSIKEVDEVLNKGCFETKAWNSNNIEIDQAPSDRKISVLGHTWDKRSDTISLKKKILNYDPQNLTKRTLFGVVAQCWDPMGLIAPVMIKYKIEIQNLWSFGYKWDDKLPDELINKWHFLLSELSSILDFSVSRSLKPPYFAGMPQLHGFADGGELGYGSCVFLRWVNTDGSVVCSLIASKSFVAPLKRKSIPRLELMGCITLSRLVDSIISSLATKLEKVCLWTDSSTALGWIRSSPRAFKPFVGLRIAEIQESHDPIIWRYIRSEHNPADVLTKGIPLEKLQKWHEGPEFLKLPEVQWPIFEDAKKSNSRNDPERKPIKITAAQAPVLPISEQLGNMTFDYDKIVRFVAIWKRFIKNCSLPQKIIGPITSDELDLSEITLYRLMQIDFDISDKHIKGLTPYKDDKGIWRAKGRLEFANNLPHTIRYPVILNKDNTLCQRLVKTMHRKLGHPGYRRLIAEARQKFWIFGLKDLCRSIYHQCIQCKKRREPLLGQQMAALPSFRTEMGTAPFENTAIDFFGPLKVKVSRRSVDKAYGCIFTCLTSRAIHLELVLSESTDHFLMALRRFASLRGWPKFIFSDKGTNFVGAQTYIRETIESWNESLIQKQCADKRTDFKWKFNCPTASHMNGAVESLIKSVRKAIDGSFQFASYTQSQWSTILYEVMYLVNSRPLYPVSNNIFEAPPITPNMLLLGHGVVVPQPEPKIVVNPRHLNNSVQQRTQMFWEQWLRHFAPSLLPRNKWFHTRDNLEIGDLCIVLDPNVPRAQWKMAIIEHLYPSADGLVRKVRIRTAVGHYDRPIHKLCLIASSDELNASINATQANV